MRPVEKVYHDHIYRQLSAVILPCHLQDFFLSHITEFALPESHTVFRHHRNFSRSIGIGLLNLCRGVSCSDPIVHLLR